MDDELKKALTDILNDTREAASQGKDFVLEQAPLVVQEYVAYTLVWSLVIASLSIAALLSTCFVYYRIWKATKSLKCEVDQVGCRITAGIVCAVVACSLGWSVLWYSSTAIKASIAPRVLILEKAAELVK